MEDLAALFESWTRDIELSVVGQQQMKERVKLLVSRLNNFCEDQGLELSVQIHLRG